MYKEFFLIPANDYKKFMKKQCAPPIEQDETDINSENSTIDPQLLLKIEEKKNKQYRNNNEMKKFELTLPTTESPFRRSDGIKLIQYL